MKRISEIKEGDIVYYRCGRVNHVNKRWNYIAYYDENFKNTKFSRAMDIMKIQRYVKVFGNFYIKKTIYKRK